MASLPGAAGFIPAFLCEDQVPEKDGLGHLADDRRRPAHLTYPVDRCTVPLVRYDEFLAAWRQVFEDPRRFSRLESPTERIDLTSMGREYATRLMAGGLAIEPFTTSVLLFWRWDSLQSARTATTEEDVLTELLGRRGSDVGTEPPWLRVDVTLAAKVHLDASLPVPEPAIWGRWISELDLRLEHHLPRAGKQVGSVSGWRGDPTVELRCGKDGQLLLSGVEVAAFEPVPLPRRWDNPERREKDRDPPERLEEIANRLRGALRVWTEALRTLQAGGQVH
jgi:hypothetical protein